MHNQNIQTNQSWGRHVGSSIVAGCYGNNDGETRREVERRRGSGGGEASGGGSSGSLKRQKKKKWVSPQTQRVVMATLHRDTT